jgi:hypothetical protein
MRSLDHRFGLFATLCATIGGFLAIVDLGETPWVFENVRLELIFFTPLALWQLCRGLYSGGRSRF